MTSYGINVANRYDLFCIDDDAGDPIEAILKSKQKQQKKQQQQQQSASAGTGAAAAPATGAGAQQAKGGNAKSGEKENKATGGGGRGAENRHPDKSDAKQHAQTNGTGNHLHNQRGGGGATGAGTERRGIKETQKDNIRNQENQRTGGGAANQGSKFPRGNGPSGKLGGTVAPGGGNDDKYPRKPRDNDDGQRKPYTQNGAGTGVGGGAGVKRFDGRGKRELDRQSGSNKTGIKAIDKRDGAGSHNWGSSKQDAKDYSNNPDGDYQPQDADTSAEANAERTTAAVANGEEGADGTGNAKSDDEAKEMTLDEWKAQKAAVRLKPQYNLRKAGEGEDASQWEKMVALDRKSAKTEGEEDEGNDTQKPVQSGGGGGAGTAGTGGGGGGGNSSSKNNKQILEIEYHFNDSRRGGLGRPRGGRGGRGGGGGGGRGMGRDGPGGRREYGDNYRSGGTDGAGGGAGGGYNNHYDGGADGGGERGPPQRDNNRRSNRPPMGGGPDRNYDGGMNKYSRPNPRSAKQHVPAAPKVDDEHDFPSLG